MQRGHPGFLLGEEKKRNRTGRGGKAGLCKKEWVCVKDIQRGPTVVVSDAGVASTYPANAHQEPDTHTHTGLALSIPKNRANCSSPTNATRSPSPPSHNPQGTNLESVYSRNPPVPSLPCCGPAFTASEKKDDCARRTKKLIARHAAQGSKCVLKLSLVWEYWYSPEGHEQNQSSFF